MPTVFFPWKPNAGRQARRAAGARDERTLAAVACTRLFGPAPAPQCLGKQFLTPFLPCCKDRERGLNAGRYSAPHGADDNRERSWTIRHSGEIAGANVPLDFAPRFGRQPRDTLANPTRPGREA